MESGTVLLHHRSSEPVHTDGWAQWEVFHLCHILLNSAYSGDVIGMPKGHRRFNQVNC